MTCAGATFVPLTLSATEAARIEVAAPDAAAEVRITAIAVDTAAAACWNALIAGCGGAERGALPVRLRELVEATATYAGPAWWFSDGSVYRGRVTEAQLRIEEAARDGDGEDFAEAFVCFDQAVASAVVCAPHGACGTGGLPLPRQSTGASSGTA